MRARFALPVASLAVLAALAPPASAQARRKGPPPAAKAPAAVDWRAEAFEKVLEEGRGRNVPVLLAFVPQEWGNLRRLRDGLFKNDRFLAAAARCLCVVAVDVEHEPEKDAPDKTKCPAFPTIACADHVQAARSLFKKVAKDGQLLAPLFVFFGPDGVERDRVENSRLQGDEGERDRQILKAAEAASAAAGPGLDRPLYVKFCEVLPKAERALEREDLGAARAVFQEIVQAAKAGLFLNRAKAGLEEVERRATALLAEAAAREASGDPTGAYDAYGDLERALAGTPQEKAAKAARQRLEQAPQTREAIAAHRRSKESAQLLAEGRALFAKGETAKAAKVFERLVREYAGTPSAELAAKELRGLSGKDGPGR